MVQKKGEYLCGGGGLLLQCSLSPAHPNLVHISGHSLARLHRTDLCLSIHVQRNRHFLADQISAYVCSLGKTSEI